MRNWNDKSATMFRFEKHLMLIFELIQVPKYFCNSISTTPDVVVVAATVVVVVIVVVADVGVVVADVGSDRSQTWIQLRVPIFWIWQG